MSQDRIDSETIPLTHEFLAHMLGTRRSSVTVAAGLLNRAGLITYTRGHAKIENRDLEDAACECYEQFSGTPITGKRKRRSKNPSDSAPLSTQFHRQPHG